MSELTKRLRIPYEPELADYLLMMSRLGEAADRIDALEECLRELISDITDSEHSPNDWSEQVVVRKARALLEE